MVVITGASSGFGRAAAIAFAREGARLALSARGEDGLNDTAEACRREGAEAIVVTTDVTDERAVGALAACAVGTFGRIDVWVNNAGVIAYGEFERMPAEVFRRVVETTFFGQVHGSRAAVGQFRRQGQGTLINMGSVWGRVTTPQVAPYVASKFALRAFSECLRQELRNDPGIDVAVMLPQAADTPVFEHAANYSGREVHPVPPLVTADDVAEGIVKCARNPKAEVTFGRAGRLVEAFHLLLPSLYSRMLPRFFERASFGKDARPHTPGNLFEPAEPSGQVSGGWKEGS